MTIKIGQESLSNTKAVGNFSYIFCIFKLYLIVDIVLGFSKWKCKIKKDNRMKNPAKAFCKFPALTLC